MTGAKSKLHNTTSPAITAIAANFAGGALNTVFEEITSNPSVTCTKDED